MSKYFLLCASCGNGKTELTSFDNALLCSGTANYNLVKVSSVLPAYAIQKKEIDLLEGSVLYTAYASKTSQKKGEIVSAAVAVGIPKDPSKIGIIMEFSDYCNKTSAEKKVHAMVVEAMASRNYEISKILCSSSEVMSDGEKYVTAFAALAMWE